MEVIRLIESAIAECGGDEDKAIEMLADKAMKDISFRMALMAYAEVTTETVH